MTDDHHHPHDVTDVVMEEKKDIPGKIGVTEWLFANESGQIAEDVNLQEIETIYNGYM